MVPALGDLGRRHGTNRKKVVQDLGLHPPKGNIGESDRWLKQPSKCQGRLVNMSVDVMYQNILQRSGKGPKASRGKKEPRPID